MTRGSALRVLLGVVVAGLGQWATSSQAQFPGRGDDVTPSLGKFNVVVDPHYEAVLNSNPAYAPFLSNKGGHLNFTSPILFDPTTTIGRSDPLTAGSAADIAGVLVGIRDPHLLRDDQLILKPSFAEGPDGTREVHTIIQSIHLMGSGFEVKAANDAPLRPFSVGEVESISGNSGDPTQDFPASSFFDVYVEIDVPALGGFPTVALVNVDPLLVQSASITSFPPKVVYIHGNSSAVPLYFYADIPAFGIHRGDLFGQLDLAGHGAGFGEADVPEFEAAEMEAEQQQGRLPLEDNPIPHVTIVDEVPPPTPTPTATGMAPSTPTATPSSTPTGGTPATVTPGTCAGDCNADGIVSIDEIITLVNIALGSSDAAACAKGIPSGTPVTIALLVRAVIGALAGCGG